MAPIFDVEMIVVMAFGVCLVSHYVVRPYLRLCYYGGLSQISMYGNFIFD